MSIHGRFGGHEVAAGGLLDVLCGDEVVGGRSGNGVEWRRFKLQAASSCTRVKGQRSGAPAWTADLRLLWRVRVLCKCLARE